MANEKSDLLFDKIDPNLRVEALRKLGAHGGPQVQNQILSLREDKDPFVRGTVFEALGNLGEPCELSQIEPGFTDTDLRVQMNAIEACRLCGLRAATNSIIRLLENPDPLIRSIAAKTLGQWKAQEASGAVERAIKSENDATTLGDLYWALLRIAPSEQTWNYLSQEHWETRNATIRAIGGGCLHGGQSTLERWLCSEETGFKWTVAKMLFGCADRPDDDFLLELSVKGEPLFKAAIMQQLADRYYPTLLDQARSLKGDDHEALKLAGFLILLRHGELADVPLIQQVEATSSGSVRDLAQIVCAALEDRAPVVDKASLAVQDAKFLSTSTCKEERLLGASLYIESGRASSEEILQALDRAWACPSPALADIVVAAFIHINPRARGLADKDFESDSIKTWAQFANLIERSGFNLIGRPKGRFSQPLQNAGVTSVRDLLLRVGYTKYGLLPNLQDGQLEMIHRAFAVDQLRDRLRSPGVR